MAFNFNNNTPKKIDLKFLTNLQNVLNVARLRSNGVTVWLQRILYTITGVPPLTANKSFGEPLEDYKIYGNSEQRNLPKEYQEVEYLESTGTQYIDTQYAFTNPKMKLEVKYRKTSLLNRNVFGVDFYPNTPRKLHGNIYNQALYLGNSSVITNVPQTLDVDYTLNFSFDNNIATWNINGTEYEYDGANGWAGVSQAETDYLFATRGTTGATYLLIGRIYYAKFYDNNDTLVRNFIPCYRKSDNVAGMYDTVNNVFYTNDGTGEFTVGADVGPTSENPIEIKSVGEKTKNLFDTNTAFGDITGVTIEDGIVSGTASQLRQMRYYFPNDLVGKELTFSLLLKTTTTTNLRPIANIAGTSVNGNFVNTPGVFTVSSVTVTPTSTDDYIVLGYNSGASGIIYAKDIQLEIGEGRTSYEPYGYKIPVRATQNNTGITTNIYLDEPLRKVPELPSEYQEVEYLESSGTQYINTGVKLSNSSNIYIKYQYVAGTVSGRVMGDSTNTNAKWVISCSGTVPSSSVQFGWGNQWLPSVGYFPAPNYDVVEVQTVGSVVSVTINGVTTTANLSADSSFTTVGNAYLFGASTGFAWCRIYRCQIDNIRDFIPCYRKSDNVAGMYDTVNNVFYTNDGTGQFIKGNDIDDVSYTDYLDYANQKVIRNVEVINDTGELPIEQSYKRLEIPVEESVTLPDILTNEGSNTIEVLTDVQPSNMEIQYEGTKF